MRSNFYGGDMSVEFTQKTLGFILAGGLGTRLRPYTLTLPKPMLPINERPILELLLLQMKYYGINDVVVSLGYLGDIVKAYCKFLSKKPDFPSQINFVDEDKPLGTCGPLSRLTNEMIADKENILVINGDILSDICFHSLLRHHTSTKAFLTVAIRQSIMKLPLGEVDVDVSGRIINFREKPEYKALDNLGIYVYSMEALSAIPTDTFYGADNMILDNLDKQITSYRQDGDYMWIDVGTHSEFEKVQLEFDQIMSNLKFLKDKK